MIRKLEDSDFLKMKRLRSEKATHAGASAEFFSNGSIMTLSDSYFKYPNIGFGMFEPDLTSYILCSTYKDFWVLDLMISSNQPEDLRMILNHCLIYYESLKINKFYYAFPWKWKRAYSSWWKDGSDLLKKYVITDHYIIESFKKPDDEFIWNNIMKHTVVPVKLLVRSSEKNVT